MNVTPLRRHPSRPHSRLALSEERAERQIKRGLHVVERGEPFALPVDRLSEPTVFQSRTLWQINKDGEVSRCGSKASAPHWLWVPKAWKVADVVTGGRATVLRNMLAYGHDVHVTNWGNLYARHWHSGWANPFTGRVEPALDLTFATLRDTHFVQHECDLEVCPATWGTWDRVRTMLAGRGGFLEDCGWLAGAKVTDAFVSEEIDELVDAAGTEYADFDHHEVGTSLQAEDNNDTALIATTGIARDDGTPTDVDPIYRSVGSITADATESWEEHGLFNNVTGAALLDRSLTGGQSVNSSDVVEYTYELTKNPEA